MTPLSRDLEFLQRGAGQDGHALLGQRLLEEGGDVRIFHRHDPVEHFDHGHIGAHVVVEAGEFDPDRADADHQQLARHFGRGHRVAIGPHALAVGRGEGQIARPRAGGDDDVLGGELLFALVAPFTVRLVAPGQRALPMCTAILFFFIRCVTPWLSCLATPRLRFTTASRSASISLAASP